MKDVIKALLLFGLAIVCSACVAKATFVYIQTITGVIVTAACHVIKTFLIL